MAATFLLKSFVAHFPVRRARFAGVPFLHRCCSRL